VATKIIEAAIRLHNFCITERLLGNDSESAPAPCYATTARSQQASEMLDYLPASPEAFVGDDAHERPRRGSRRVDDAKRLSILQEIRAAGLQCPTHNVERMLRDRDRARLT
jgi:hypothetical protein